MSGIEKEKGLGNKEGWFQNLGPDNSNDGMASPRDGEYSRASEGGALLSSRSAVEWSDPFFTCRLSLTTAPSLSYPTYELIHYLQLR